MCSGCSSYQEGSGWLPVPAWALSSFLPQCRDMNVGIIGDSKLAVGVDLSDSSYLSLPVIPAMDR